jgi:DNA-directed RNA polymerase subunit beta'
MKRYREIKLYDEDNEDLDKQMQEIMEQRKIEEAAEKSEAINTADISIEETDDD